MSSYKDFMAALYAYVGWSDWCIPHRQEDNGMRAVHFMSLTGTEIRKYRSEAQNFMQVMDANSPTIIGVDTPPWMWTRLTEYLYNLPDFDPYEYDYRSYDKETPGAYHGDRMALKELFAGGIYAKYDLGEKIDGTRVDEPTFRCCATKYLISLISQIAQISREQAIEAKGDGDEAPAESTKPVSETE